MQSTVALCLDHVLTNFYVQLQHLKSRISTRREINVLCAMTYTWTATWSKYVLITTFFPTYQLSLTPFNHLIHILLLSSINLYPTAVPLLIRSNSYQHYLILSYLISSFPYSIHHTGFQPSGHGTSLSPSCSWNVQLRYVHIHLHLRIRASQLSSWNPHNILHVMSRCYRL